MKQNDKAEHIRHVLLFLYNQGSKAAEAARAIRLVYGNDAVTDRTSQRWFTQFEKQNFSLKDSPRSGRPAKFDEKKLSDLLRENPNQSSRTLAKKMGCNNTTISRHLQSMRNKTSFRTSTSPTKFVKKHPPLIPTKPRPASTSKQQQERIKFIQTNMNPVSKKTNPLLDNKLQPLEDTADDEGAEILEEPPCSASSIDNDPLQFSLSEFLKYYPY